MTNIIPINATARDPAIDDAIDALFAAVKLARPLAVMVTFETETEAAKVACWPALACVENGFRKALADADEAEV